MDSTKKVKKGIMYDFEVNDRVILETDLYGIMEGTIISYDQDKTRYTLSNVSYKSTGNCIKGTRQVYTNNIRSGSAFKPEILDDCSTSESCSSSSCDSISDTSSSGDGISFTELDHMRGVSKTYRYIQYFDEAYTNALEDLCQHEYIGLIAEDSDFRSKTLHVMALSTPYNIYLFDLLSLGKMRDDMKQLLEDSEFKKITFNCNRLADSLKFHYQVTLDGVFDIQLADIYITKIKTGGCPTTFLTYQECVSKYLKIPANFIKKPMLPQNGSLRPLSNNFKAQLAQNISFMQTLSLKLYNKILGPLQNACNRWTNSVRSQEDEYEAGMLVALDDSVTESLIVAFNEEDSD